MSPQPPVESTRPEPKCGPTATHPPLPYLTRRPHPPEVQACTCLGPEAEGNHILRERTSSNLINLRRHDGRVCLGDGIATRSLVVEGALVLVGVPVRRAVNEAAAALEAREAHALVAGVAPAGVLLLPRLLATSLLGGNDLSPGRLLRLGRRRGDGGGHRDLRGHSRVHCLDGGLNGLRHLVLGLHVAEALGAHVHIDRVAVKPAASRAEHGLVSLHAVLAVVVHIES
mmetsp:Transcript_12663/g.39976  ORF Transcript_12663/g.39976 Transcript_12663/m.39976 type:complete len:228 (-) Transcript_12663:201-884(-)